MIHFFYLDLLLLGEVLLLQILTRKLATWQKMEADRHLPMWRSREGGAMPRGRVQHLLQMEIIGYWEFHLLAKTHNPW